MGPSGSPPRGETRRIVAAAMASMLLILAGCGDGGRLPLYPATGTVLVDGRPARGVEVRLHPVDRVGDLDAPRPFASSGEDGGFRLGTYLKGDGAPAGRYKVTLFWSDRPPRSDPGDDLLGGRYADPARSALEVTISEGDNRLGPFEVQKAPKGPRRPRARPDMDGLDAAPSR
jgi:hypothetical protein